MWGTRAYREEGGIFLTRLSSTGGQTYLETVLNAAGELAALLHLENLNFRHCKTFAIAEEWSTIIVRNRCSRILIV